MKRDLKAASFVLEYFLKNPDRLNLSSTPVSGRRKYIMLAMLQCCLPMLNYIVCCFVYVFG